MEASKRRQLLSRIAAESERALVLSEGLVPYLRTEEAALLADELRAHRPFRYWIVDYFSPATRRFGMRMGPRTKMRNAPFRFDPDDYFAFFRRHGWAPREIRYLSEEGKKRNRALKAPLKFRLALMRLFMSKSRRDALNKSAAYVLFEPRGGDRPQREPDTVCPSSVRDNKSPLASRQRGRTPDLIGGSEAQGAPRGRRTSRLADQIC